VNLLELKRENRAELRRLASEQRHADPNAARFKRWAKDNADHLRAYSLAYWQRPENAERHRQRQRRKRRAERADPVRYAKRRASWAAFRKREQSRVRVPRKAPGCHVCGRAGHYAKTCELRKPGPAPLEARPVHAVQPPGMDVTKYIGLVNRIARKMGKALPRSVRLEDLISAGSLGLLDASKRYDPERNDCFEIYASYRIRGAILDELREADSLSRDMRRLWKQLERATSDLANQLGRAPSDAEVAAHLGITVAEMYDRRAKLTGAMVVGMDDVDRDFLDHTQDATALDPFEQTSLREELARLAACIGRLPKFMQQALSLYYLQGLNLREVGVVMGVSESRVCQIHGEAAQRLRAICPELDGQSDGLAA
jgi:RNA polymerase sigma factor for flagellar operon FliA